MSTGEVNAGRFNRGLSYERYIASIENNVEEFRRNYDALSLSQADRDFFAGIGVKLGTKIKFLALAEDWCPDVVRGLPVAARIAEASPDIELRVFARDENLDIADLYLKEGKYRSIPTFVFFDESFREIGRWIERPASADSIMREVKEMQVQQGLSDEQARALRRQKLDELYVSKLAPDTIAEIKEVLGAK